MSFPHPLVERLGHAPALQAVDQHPACDIAHCMPAHPVGYRPEPVLGAVEARVFVDLAYETHVRAGGRYPSKLTDIAHDTSATCSGTRCRADGLPLARPNRTGCFTWLG